MIIIIIFTILLYLVGGNNFNKERDNFGWSCNSCSGLYFFIYWCIWMQAAGFMSIRV